ncbi:MAG TPA: alpha/beta hydrolase [Vicinamibacterales bacterium]|nr:alpha/beta hydrolase [Vicinamibacterales bacterium]
MNAPVIHAALVLAVVLSTGPASAQATDMESRVTHGYADSGGVRIHYAELGKGPLVVMMHGFPDYWYTWRHQMDALAAAGFRVAAMDLRGYNLSDQPTGEASYDMKLLVGDVAAVIRHLGESRAIVVGHDWGGAIAWLLALTRPDLVERLIILNLPHPRGIQRELATNPAQQKNSQYARDFQQAGSHEKLAAEKLAGWVTDPAAREKYIEAFRRSSFDGMMSYYRRNYPREPYTEDTSPVVKTTMPVLMIHGLDDWALLAPMLNGTWDWMGKDLTLVTIPGAGHFVQQDASELVSRSMVAWLKR